MTTPSNLPAVPIEPPDDDYTEFPDEDPALTYPAIIGYPMLERRPVRGRSGRSDWVVQQAPPTTALEAPDFVSTMRQFFAAMDAEIDQYLNDPIATTSALARIEALLADLRYLKDRLNDVTANSMHEHRIRVLTVEGVATIEASNETKRTNWQHHRLLTDIIMRTGIFTIDGDGALMSSDELATWLLSHLTPNWKVTKMRDELHINPDDYCTVERDDDGKPIKTPTVRIHDNRIRGRK